MAISPATVRDAGTPACGQEDEEDDHARPHIAPAKDLRILTHALSGTLGALLAECVVLPVDQVKLRVQTASETSNAGFFAVAVNIIRQQGIGGFYSGLSGALIKESVHSLNYWLFHGWLFGRFAKYADTSKTHPGSRLLLNLVAKQLNWLCTVPFEVISSNNQLQQDSPGFFATAVSLYRSGGFGIFYSGLSVSLFLAINPAIMNTLITTLLRLVARARQLCGADYLEAREHSPAVIGGVTALSKAVATVLTYPLILAKVLQQTRYVGKTASFWRILSDIINAEGIRGLYRGVLAMSYKTILWNSLMMFFKHALGPKRLVTPPGTPPAELAAMTLLRNVPPMAVMAREPFPAEMTVEKLDEILGHLRTERPEDKRVHKLENRLEEVNEDIKEMRKLLVALVEGSSSMGARNGVTKKN
jgi:hypothetical protein